jgi:hypothetical protein
MLKLEKNRKLLRQSRKKSNVKKEGSSLIIGTVQKKAEEEILGLFT